MTEIKGSYEKEGPVLVDTHGKYLESPRRVAGEMNVSFIDLNKLIMTWYRYGSREFKKIVYVDSFRTI